MTENEGGTPRDPQRETPPTQPLPDDSPTQPVPADSPTEPVSEPPLSAERPVAASAPQEPAPGPQGPATPPAAPQEPVAAAPQEPTPAAPAGPDASSPYGQQGGPAAYGPPATAYGQPGAPAPQYGYAPTPPKNDLAVWSLVSGILSFVMCPLLLGVAAIITGVMSRRAADEGLANNRGMGTAGLILGWINVALVAIGIVFFIVALAVGLFAGGMGAYDNMNDMRY